MNNATKLASFKITSVVGITRRNRLVVSERKDWAMR